VQDCLASWREQMPDATLIEWNEQTFETTTHCRFVREAAEAQKWAYVADYVRLWALWHVGGLYCDADVQMLKPLDRFLPYRAFTGHEADTLLLAAVMGAEPHHPWIGSLLAAYETMRFNPKRLVPNTQVVTELSRGMIERQHLGYTYLQDGVVIFPTTYFAGWDHQRMQPIVTEDTYALHHFAGTWLSRDLTGRTLYQPEETRSC